MIIVPSEKSLDWKYAPVVVFSIVVLNILVYFLYQTSDQQKYLQALELYQANNLLETEWPLFVEYLEKENDSETLERAKGLYEEQAYIDVSSVILSRVDFYEYLSSDPHNIVGYFSLDAWQQPRLEVSRWVNSVSSFAHGLRPDKFSLSSFITHQFLHGDVMHLIGNLAFLIIFGFAVEAAIGPLWFIGFYLLSGVVGGALHVIVESSSHAPLIGASGAISGVMAMYLGVFRFRKIEFFYWFFVFVGYFRAPALLLLPVYIGKELYSFYFTEGSNVAFMAHIGGFVMGAAAIVGAIFLKPDVINEAYIEEDQSLDPKQERLAKVYQLVESAKFSLAVKEIEDIEKEFGSDFTLLKLKYLYSRIAKLPTFGNAWLALLKTKPTTESESRILQKAWQDNQKFSPKLPLAVRVNLGLSLCDESNIETSEKLFNEVFSEQSKTESLEVLALKLSEVFKKRGVSRKEEYYNQLAQQIVDGVAS
ncbi:MAG: rhomboid family intramembrane serine protease [Agarilytica sp.]